MIEIIPIQKMTDATPVKKLILSILKELGFRYDPKYDKDLDNLTIYYQQEGNAFFILLKDKIPIGTIAIEKKNKRTAIFKRFYLKKEERGKGFGKLLYQKAEDSAKLNGYQKITLETTTKNKSAVLFFQKQNFILTKQKRISLFFEKNFRVFSRKLQKELIKKF